MQLLDLTLPTLEENLALDEALLLEAEDGNQGEVLRFWEWPKTAVVLGAGCRVAEDVNEPACRHDGVPMARRASGGGTVLLGRGCLLYSLVLTYKQSPELMQIGSSYRFILGKVSEALGQIAPGVTPAGISDLAVSSLKVSGNSQQRKRTHLLHHGTLLYAFDIERVGRYLHQPIRQPEYRERRAHSAFIRNLATKAPALRQALRSAWSADGEVAGWPAERVRELVQDKYAQTAWTHRR